jgi:hypothetical protein
MLGTAVPEAAVHENRDTPPREHDVGASAQPLHHRAIDEEPHSFSMESTPQGELGTRVPLPLSLHPAAYVV